MNKNAVKLLRCFRNQCSPAAAQPCWLRRNDRLPDGINLHAFLLANIGLGESARLLFRAIETQNVPVAACNWDLPHRGGDPEFRDLISEDAPYRVSIQVNGLTSFRKLRHQICRRKYNIGYLFWELDTIRQRHRKVMKQYDRFWAPSKFICDLLKANGFDNVDLVKQPLHVPSVEPDFFKTTGPLKFLFHFDFESFAARKNPEAAVHAFRRAFGRSADVRLTVKTRGNDSSGRRQWLEQQAAEDPRIQVIDRQMTREEVTGLLMEHDVFVSLHRSEGLGLGIAEAIAAGKAVVVTDYGGSTDLVTRETGYPVEWTRVAVKPEDYTGVENATWAEPSIEHAATMLRAIYDDPQTARVRTEAAFRHLQKNHAFPVIGKTITATLRKHGQLAP